MEVDKGTDSFVVSTCGVCAIDKFLSVVVKGEKDFVFHIFNL
jgi:hypothetical protein